MGNMVTTLLSSLLAVGMPGEMPVRIVDAKKSPFTEISYLAKSPSNAPLSFVLLRDKNKSEFAYKTVADNIRDLTIVELVTKTQKDEFISWLPDGSIVPKSSINTTFLSKAPMKPGEVGIVTRSKANSRINPKSEDTVLIFSANTRKQRLYLGDYSDEFQVLGRMDSNFVDLKLYIAFTKLVATLQPKISSKATVEGAEFQILEPSTFRNDGRVHFEISGPAMLKDISYSFKAEIDWERVQAEHITDGRFPVESDVQLVREATAGSPRIIDLSSSIPLKYWKGISILVSGSVDGYASHLAFAPIH